MSIIGEYRSATTASQLEVVLLEAVARGGEVKEFAKQCLYDWYLGECEDSYGIHKPDPEIIAHYKD